jgi:hypothetical protein
MMAARFFEKEATMDVIKKAGKVAMIIISGGTPDEGIDTLRYE